MDINLNFFNYTHQDYSTILELSKFMNGVMKSSIIRVILRNGVDEGRRGGESVNVWSNM